MTQSTGLSGYRVVAFVNIVDIERAKSFYRDTLGLRLVSEDLPFALVFDANGIMLRLSIVKSHSPSPGTVLGWQVADITPAVRDLARAGVQFERYDFLQQDEIGIWTSPTAARVAWFKDPDGNVLSLSEHPEAKK
jgi:catechol 2,3-dioxygenase-like lactoylglutathione lyase family enzyme